MPTISADGKYYVDLGPDYAFGTGSFVSVYPENCSFDQMIRGVGNTSFQLSFSATDQDNNPAVTAPVNMGTVGSPSWVPKYGPYRTYWRLRYGDVFISAGVLTNTNSAKGSDYMSLAGKTWEHLFEKWIYPDDARAGWPNTYVFPKSYTGNEVPIGAGHDTPTSLVYEAANRDVIRIWADILGQTMSLGYRVPLDASALSGLSGIKSIYFTYDWGDMSTMDQLANNLSGTGDGFDWWISANRVVHWASPYRYGNPNAPYLFDTITDTGPTPTKGIEVSFNNDGPISTHETGSGSGLALPTTLRRSIGSPDNEAFFSRLDSSHDFGDVRSIDEMVSRTSKQLLLDIQPQHNIPLTMYPAQYAAGERQYWLDYRCGRAIGMNLDFFYHKVVEPQQLVSHQTTLSNEGEATVNWTIQQIYPLNLEYSGAPGPGDNPPPFGVFEG